MSKLLNFNQMLDFAILLEMAGYEFYTESAKKFDNLELIRLFHLLAEEEFRHQYVFKRMKQAANPQAPWDVSNSVDDQLLRELVESVTLAKNNSIREKVERLETIAQALELAFSIERDSVILYSTMKHFVKEEHKAAVESVIQEEVDHVLKLQKFKAGEIPPIRDVDAI